jgi:hypothetical protein
MAKMQDEPIVAKSGFIYSSQLSSSAAAAQVGFVGWTSTDKTPLLTSSRHYLDMVKTI